LGLTWSHCMWSIGWSFLGGMVIGTWFIYLFFFFVLCTYYWVVYVEYWNYAWHFNIHSTGGEQNAFQSIGRQIVSNMTNACQKILLKIELYSQCSVKLKINYKMYDFIPQVVSLSQKICKLCVFRNLITKRCLLIGRLKVTWYFLFSSVSLILSFLSERIIRCFLHFSASGEHLMGPSMSVCLSVVSFITLLQKWSHSTLLQQWAWFTLL
jgi:hypothetical protein